MTNTASEDGRVKLPPKVRFRLRQEFRKWVNARAAKYAVSHMTIRRALANEKAEKESEGVAA